MQGPDTVFLEVESLGPCHSFSAITIPVNYAGPEPPTSAIRHVLAAPLKELSTLSELSILEQCKKVIYKLTTSEHE